MKRNPKDQTEKKIDVILSGMETIGNVERSTDKEEMLYRFKHIVDGAYAQKLYSKFGKRRVENELFLFLEHDFFVRSGGGIGITRLIHSMLKENIIPKEQSKV